MIAFESSSGRPRRLDESASEGLLLDGFGLVISLAVSWLVVATVVTMTLGHVVPASRGSIVVAPIIAFSIGFVGLDYLQYWTHRLFHGRVLWRFHLLHHTARRMRGVGAFRHSLPECLLSPVFWCHGVIAWLLVDPSYYLIAVSTGFILDIWRHSPFETEATGPLSRFFHAALVTPEDHAMHHRDPEVAANYGVNLKVWDRLHGTYRAPDELSPTYGVANGDGLLRLLLGAARTGQTVIELDAS